MSWTIGVDVGGTFTDFVAVDEASAATRFHKRPSTPEDPARAIIAGVEELCREAGIEPAAIGRLSHGTTVGTNALIQRRVGKVAMVTTRGFRDLIEIGRQTRPKVYDIHQDHPPPLVPRHLRLEVTERMRADGSVHLPLDEAEVERAGRVLAAEKVDSVAVCFLHAHAFPQHEQRAAEILRRVLGNAAVVVPSCEVYPEFREFERFSTTVLNAALITVMHAYFAALQRDMAARGIPCEPTVSHSAGALMSIDMARRFPVRTALSGPAAGALGAAAAARRAGFPSVITLDVGGTSADVLLLSEGSPAVVHRRMLAGFPLRLPVLDVNSVGAGGGSIAWIDRDGLLKVGPFSAGAVPGPACYNQGGSEATVTDAQVLLGRLNGEALLGGSMPIRKELAEAAVARVAGRIGLDPVETALGIVRLACATMVKAIRAISVERGHDPSAFALFAFGGAGPLHATDTARELDITRIIVPPHPGILCAEGLLNADLSTDIVQSAAMRFGPDAVDALNEARARLSARADAWFDREGVAPVRRRQSWALDLRYHGQNFELSIPAEFESFNDARCGLMLERFHAAHERAYGFAQPDEPVELVSLRVRLVGVLDKPAMPELPSRPPGAASAARRVCFGPGDWRETPVWERSALARDQVIEGPAIIEQMDSTTPLHPGDTCRVDRFGNLVIELGRPLRP